MKGMRTSALILGTVMAGLAAGRAGAEVNTETWDAAGPGVNGWLHTVAWTASGGPDGSAFLSVTRTGGSPYARADDGSSGGLFVGDLITRYGNVINLLYDGKIISGSFSSATIFFKRIGSDDTWSHSFPLPAGGSWESLKLRIDSTDETGWTHAGGGTATLAETLAAASDFLIDTSTSGSSPWTLGVDNFTMETPPTIITETWNDVSAGANGWLHTVVWTASGGPDGSAFLSVTRSSGSPYTAADDSSSGGAFVGDLIARYGDVFTLVYDGKMIASAFSGATMFLKRIGSDDTWSHSFPLPAGGGWETLNVPIDSADETGWTHSGGGTATLAETLAAVSYLLIDTSASGPGPWTLGLDNFSMKVPLPPGGTVIAVR